MSAPHPPVFRREFRHRQLGGQFAALGGELAGEVPPRLPLDVRGERQVQVPQGEVTRGGEVEVDAFDFGNVRFLLHHRLQGSAPPFSGVV